MTARRGVLRVRNSLIACTLTAAVLFSSADAAIAGVDCGDYSTVTVQNEDVWRCCSAERAKGFDFWVQPDADEKAYHNVRVKILDTRQNKEYDATAGSCNVLDDGDTCTGESCYRPSSAYKWRCESLTPVATPVTIIFNIASKSRATTTMRGGIYGAGPASSTMHI